MAAALATTLTHIVILTLYLFTVYCTFYVLDIPFLREAYREFDVGQLKYLTVWNVTGENCIKCQFDMNRFIKMRERFLAIYHAAMFVQFAFSVYYDLMHTHVPLEVGRVHNAYGGKFKFLTFWDAIAQTVFFLICLLNDIFGSNNVSPKKRPLIRKIKDFFHAAIGFPVSMFVGITFWALMFVDRELVLPKALDPYFPWWLNHLMHTMIMVATVLEMLLAPRQYPKRSQGLGGLTAFMLTYLAWMHFVYYKSGVWAYPIIEVLTWPLRIAFYLVLLVFMTGLYYAGEALDRLIWGTTVKVVEKASKKKK